MLYLDNAASTKLNKEVLDEMFSSLEAYGNSEARFYAQAENAKKLISKARHRVASLVHAEDDEVIFTSGATESNNLVLKGRYFAAGGRGKIIISAIEHSSVYDTCQYLKSQGCEIVIIPVDATGRVNLQALEEAIDDCTILVSIIYVNNEIGTIQDLKAIDAICHRYNVLLHTDATQAVGKVEIDLRKFHALTYLTFTSHKIYGPKGIGCLISRKYDDEVRGELVPLLHGGEQENGMRAGTLPTFLIVGFGKACEIAQRDFIRNYNNLKNFESIVLQKLTSKFSKNIRLNNDFPDRIPGLLNIRFCGYNNMVLLKAISAHIAASTGSACSISKPSRVLQNIGLTEQEISESVRFSLSAYIRSEDLEILDLL